MFIIDTINDRIRLLLEITGMTKTEFGKKLKVSQAYISKLVKTGTPSPRLIENICKKFGVNEKWLCDGEGEIFTEHPPENEVTAAVSEILEDIQCENAMYTLIKEFLINYQKSDSKTKEALDIYLNNVLEGYQKRKEGN